MRINNGDPRYWIKNGKLKGVSCFTDEYISLFSGESARKNLPKILRENYEYILDRSSILQAGMDFYQRFYDFLKTLPVVDNDEPLDMEDVIKNLKTSERIIRTLKKPERAAFILDYDNGGCGYSEGNVEIVYNSIKTFYDLTNSRHKIKTPSIILSDYIQMWSMLEEPDKDDGFTSLPLKNIIDFKILKANKRRTLQARDL